MDELNLTHTMQKPTSVSNNDNYPLMSLIRGMPGILDVVYFLVSIYYIPITSTYNSIIIYILCVLNNNSPYHSRSINNLSINHYGFTSAASDDIKVTVNTLETGLLTHSKQLFERPPSPPNISVLLLLLI